MSQKNDWTEFTAFLKPISDGLPSGKSIRYAPIYDEIREARRQEDLSLPQGVWKREMKGANWSLSNKLCTKVLTTESKDLQVAAWLAEAWLHEKGIAGLSNGVRLMHALCEKFWDSIHPEIDEDGADYRLSPVDWLNEKIPEQMNLYAISNPEMETMPYYTLAEYDYLLNQGDQKVTEKSANIHKEITQAALQSSIKSTANYFYEILHSDCLKAITALEEFEQFLTEKLPNNAVTLYQLRASLGRFRDCMLSVLRERNLLDVTKKTLELATIVEPESTAMNDEQQAPVALSAPINSSIESREQAYAMIADIAKYLEAVEPHSPTPYLLKKAITWGNMPLSYLLQEFIQNNMDFVQLQRWLGIPTPTAENPTIAQQN